MRYYVHHIGDWMTDTAYCDWMQSAAYHKLIMVYYASEQALPNDLPAIYRAIGAATIAEKEATRHSLHRFFALNADDDKWHQKRCDEEITKAREFVIAQRENANKRWEDRPKRGNRITEPLPTVPNVRNRVVERIKSGIETETPRTSTNGSERTRRCDGISGGNAMAMPSINTVLTTSLKHTLVISDALARETAGVCLKNGVQVKAEDPRLIALLADGATPADFEAGALLAVAAGRGWAYCAGIVANRLADAIRMGQEGPQKPSGSPNYPMLPRWHDPH